MSLRLSKSISRKGIAASVAIAAALAVTGLAHGSASAADSPLTADTYIPRYADCPSKGTTVTTSTALQNALKKATAGSVIKLAPGTYRGDFTIKSSGTAKSPIWICGPDSAVLTNESIDDGHPLTLDSVKYVVATGFSVQNAYKGVTVISSDHVAVTDLNVSQIGYEGIHLRNQTTDSAVAYNHISRTGLTEAKYGEGIYIGTSGRNWCKFNNCNADLTTRILIRGNVISDTGAQPIEVKEGSTNGFIDQNLVFGSDRIEAYSRELIAVNGNGYLATNNVVKNPGRSHDFQSPNNIRGR